MAREIASSLPRRSRLIVFCGIFVVSVCGTSLWRSFRNYESTDDAQVDAHICPVSARVSGRVLRVNVRDNEYVEKGTLLAEIDPKEYYVAVEHARTRLRNAMAASPLTLESAQASGEASRGAWRRSALMRARELFCTAVVAQRRADLEQAELNLSYTKIIAPVSGLVSKTTLDAMNVHQGQQLLTIISVQDVWITAGFKERQLRFIRPGLRTECYLTASGRTYEGHVDSIAAIVDGHRVQVRIVLDDGENRDLHLRPDMKVVCRVYSR